MVSTGIALLALGGIGTTQGVGVRFLVVAGTICGAILLGAFGVRGSRVPRGSQAEA